jgi:arginyl-tRNA--protein-N-Asp/Glu arginylyltransferase
LVRAACTSLPHAFLGYWVDDSKLMACKSRFRPLECLGPGGWQRFDPEQRELPLV